MASRASLRPWLNTRLPYVPSSSAADRPCIRSAVSSVRTWSSWADPPQAGPSNYAAPGSSRSAYSTSVGSSRHHQNHAATDAAYHESLRRAVQATPSRTQQRKSGLPSTSVELEARPEEGVYSHFVVFCLSSRWLLTFVATPGLPFSTSQPSRGTAISAWLLGSDLSPYIRSSSTSAFARRIAFARSSSIAWAVSIAGL